MSDTIFFRLLDGVNRPSRLSTAIEELHDGGEAADLYAIELASFRQVPNSPFCYWVSEKVRRIFSELPPFEDETQGRTTRCGLSTLDNFQFLRLRWEVASPTLQVRFLPYYDGGVYSPIYDDFPLVLRWGDDGTELKSFVENKVGSASRKIQGEDHYFRAGFVFPRRTKAFSPKFMHSGGIYSTAGQAGFLPEDDLEWGIGLLSSKACNRLISLSQGGGQSPQFEVGLIKRLPWPSVSKSQKDELAAIAHDVFETKRSLASVSETSGNFVLPSLHGETDNFPSSITEGFHLWQQSIAGAHQKSVRNQERVDDVAYQLYGIEGEDRRAIEEPLGSGDGGISNDDEFAEAEDTTTVLDSGTMVADLLSYTVGCVFGRWDARIALDLSLAPQLQDPFAPLPVCSPGMLVGTDGLPAQRDGIASEEWMRARPDAITPPPEGFVENPTIPDSEYPLAVDWDGILADESDHPDDIVGRVREVFGLLWGERADGIEAEACEVLGVKDLRAYFRNPRKFFDFHIKRYSKSRRKAPIYWLLQSPKKNYGLWIYYHRLDSDLLFKALTNYVEPKIRLEESRLEEYETRRRSVGTGGSEAKKAEKAVEKQEDLLSDLREFRDRLARAANLYLEPDLNDGVVLNIAPLHELVPWKEAAGKWKELLAGKYEWSSIGKQLRAKGIVS